MLRMLMTAATIAATLTVSAAAQDMTIRYASPAPSTDQTQEAIDWYMAEVTRRTEGKVKFEAFLGNSLVKDQDILTAVGDGVVDMAKVFTISYPAQLPLSNMFNLPFTTPSPYVAMNTINQLFDEFPELKQEYLKFDTIPIGTVSTGAAGFLSTRPFGGLDDLKGFKVRARGVQAEIFQAAGAIPASIPWNDVYEALSKGVVDGSTNYIAHMSGTRHNEVPQYYTAAPLGQAVQVHIVNKQFWDGLPEDIRGVLADTMRDAEQRYAERMSEAVVAERKNLAEKYSALTADQIAQLRSLAPDFFAQWVAANAGSGDPAKLLARYNELSTRFTEEGRGKGLVDMWY